MTSGASGDEQLSFNEHIRPIFNQHCVACHGGVEQAGGLSFVHGDAASYIVEPGEPDASYLIERVTSEDPEERMPPPDHGKGLSQQEIDLLRTWIQQGGNWGKHWAFVKPEKSEPPIASSEDSAWTTSRIDAFVLKRMRQAGLAPAPEADPQRWLRRVTLDLTGLPPTPEELAEFLQAVEAQGAAAYEATVDRLLKSPAFGERWASVWLDVVRYADSKGLGLDGRRTIWKYRDWVIRAFNADMPFDEFTVKQIAGDLLPDPSMDDLVATACNRLTQTCEEGGTDDEMFRVEAVIDRVNTNMTAWQGLTFGCVQCHSHPYDPIQHAEYYKLLAFFNNTADSDLGSEEPNVLVPLEHNDTEEARVLDRQIEATRETLWEEAYDVLANQSQWSELRDFEVSTNNSTKVVTAEVDGHFEYQTRGTVAKETTVVVEAAVPSGLTQLAALRFTGLPKDEKAARMDSEWGFVISHIQLELLEGDADPRILEIADVIADQPQTILDPMLSLNAKSQHGFGAYSRIHYPRTGYFVLAEAIPVSADARLRISLRQDVFETGAFPLVAHRGRLAITGDAPILDWESQQSVQQRRAELADMQARRRKIPSVRIPVLRELPVSFSRPTHVFDRGNYLTKTDGVPASTPEILGGPQANEEHALNRLDLARWIASPENPLTARVAVNRFWAQLFGSGIVRTQEDFGSSGDAPTHPDLLNDLAARFSTEMGWSVKTLLRELVLSSTYRQSSVVSSDKLAADPQNVYLSRGPRRRLPAETIRDQALAISGLLSKKQFGEPVHPPIPDGIWLPFQGGDRWDTPDRDDPDRYRRTIYTYIKRTIQFPVMASFDAPTREFCAPRRLPSNTPLQALMTLNDATFVEASQALAERMFDHSVELQEQLQYGFLLATCRDPQPRELQPLIDLYEIRRNEEDAHAPDEAGTESTRLNALTSVASVLLNLDEVLNK